MTIAVEIKDITWLKPYAANAKKHPPEQIKKLAAAITKFGWTQPIIAWTDGSIIAGHGRRLAALELGLEVVPVVVRSDLSKVQADALRLADNRVTSTEYDMAAIQTELQAISDQLDGSFSMEDMGFDEKELEFSLGDLSTMDTSFFADDIGAAVEEQKRANAEKVKETDDTAAPVGDALGFKRVTVAQSRQLRDLMNGIETKTGKKGVDALIDVLSAAA
jgi:ParB-like chromosome segregation protein Spo0J